MIQAIFDMAYQGATYTVTGNYWPFDPVAGRDAQSAVHRRDPRTPPLHHHRNGDRATAPARAGSRRRSPDSLPRSIVPSILACDPPDIPLANPLLSPYLPYIIPPRKGCLWNR